MAKTDFKTPDAYIAAAPEADRPGLEAIRKAIRDAVPDADEVISYQLPAFRLGKSWIFYYGVFTNHFALSFPPPFTFLESFKDELSAYKQSKSAIQLPKDRPLPLALIGEMAAFRAGGKKA